MASVPAWRPAEVVRYLPRVVARGARYCAPPNPSGIKEFDAGCDCMSTIKSAREIDAIFRTAARVAHPLLIALIARTPEGRGPSGRVAFIAGKRLGNAVLRNRCRRVLREAVRRAHGPWAGYDVALIARPKTPTASRAELDAALSSLVDRAGLSA